MVDITKETVAYYIPEMDDIEISRDMVYYRENNNELNVDIYYPKADRAPLVIFVFGYSDETITKMVGSKLKNMDQYISWSRLIAASGMVAAVYETNHPEKDIFELIKYLRKNAERLNIDANRIAIWSCSGNVPVALSAIARNEDNLIKCAVFYYGFMLGDNNFASDGAKQVGFTVPEGIKLNQVSPDIPQLIVRAGMDEVPNVNNSIDHYINDALANNKSITFVNHNQAPHAFEILDKKNEDNKNTIEIIKKTVNFIKFHLNNLI